MDLRGRDGYLGRLTVRAHDSDTLDAAMLLERVNRAAVTQDNADDTDNRRLRLCDSDTFHVLEFVRDTAGKVGSELSEIVRTHPTGRLNWSLPRRPGRPEGMEVRVAAEHGTLATEPPRYLHGMMFTIELCAAELCAACLALHAFEAPTALIVDLAKQVFDEIRHFRMLELLLARHGAAIGDYPIDTVVWDKFLLGETLAERLVIEQRLGEGCGLDGGLLLYRRYSDADDAIATQVFDFINADEMTHVRNGNRWITELAGGQDNVATLDAELRDRLAAHDWPIIHREPINSTDRLLSGFTRNEVAAIREEARESAVPPT